MAGELDAELWSRLPIELMDLVLQRLPLSSLCKFRAVCKHWSTLPTVSAEDPYFLCFPSSCLAFGHYDRCKLYSFARNQWEDLDFSFLLQHCLGENSSDLIRSAHIRLDNSCSDGGLVCFNGAICTEIDNPDKSFLVVCNPLTRTTKSLPRLDPDIADMHPDPYELTEDYLMHRDPSGAYKIFVVVVEFFVQLHYYMYDSNSEIWERILTLKRDDAGMKNLRSCSTVFNGVYYCVSGGGIHAYELSAYNIKEDRWVVAGVKTELDSKIKRVSFVVRNDCLLLLAKTRQNKTRVYRIDEMKLSRLDGSEEIKLPKRLDWNKVFAYRDFILFLQKMQSEFTVVDIGHTEAAKPRAIPLFPTSHNRSLYPIYERATFNLHATL